MDSRYQLITSWLDSILSGAEYTLMPASADASFRRYFRVTLSDKTLIVMDAPPDKEDSHTFIRLAKIFKSAGVNVPEVFEENFTDGFFLLSDLGHEHYLARLNESSADSLYDVALDSLLVLQQNGPTNLPHYDKKLLLAEMQLFPDWYVNKHLAYVLSADEQVMLAQTFDYLAIAALAQPRVCVHRDFHSRNLMVGDPVPGVIDFQDAVYGPVTYDLVSLLRDCYIAWPQQKVYQWATQYFKKLIDHRIIESVNERQFMEWFDLMGIQRHLKATGIFARLHYRDGKSNYLNDIPRTLNYIQDVAPDYPQLQCFAQLLQKLND